MKIKYLSILLALSILLLSIAAVSAAQDINDTISIDEKSIDDAISVNQDNSNEIKSADDSVVNADQDTSNVIKSTEKNVVNVANESSNSQPAKTTSTTTKTVKKTTVSTPDTCFMFKRNSVFKIKIKDKETNKTIKKLKISFKIKDGKKTKTYTLKTNNKGVATFKTRKLSKGYHKFTITSKNSNYQVKKKDKIFIGNLYIDTVKMGKNKKLRNGDLLRTFAQKKNQQYDKGVYAITNIDAKYTQIIKAKFFFKNKKTGQIVKVKSKGELFEIDGELYRGSIKVDLMKDYTPIKTKIYYLMSKLDN